MSRFIERLLVFTAAFVVGANLAYFFSSLDDQKGDSIDIENELTQSTSVTLTAFDPIPPGDPVLSIPEETNCTGDWLDEPDDRALVRRWLRGEVVKDSDYCSGTTTEVKGAFLNSSVIRARTIDLNGDGQDELLLKSLCSPTGNCAMTIYSRTQREYKTILSDAATQYFELKKRTHFGYSEIWTYSHESWNSGDLVVYRYNGGRYQPMACYEYEYEEVDGIANPYKGWDKRTLTQYPASRTCP